MYREVRLGDEFYFILWDDMTDQAVVARGEVIQYASDWSKVRLRIVDSPVRTVLGRSTWILPERLDTDARSARAHYQQRARADVRVAFSPLPNPRTAKGDRPVAAATEHWSKVVDAWGDVDLLLDTVEFESGWPENQQRLAKLGMIAILAMRPDLLALLEALGPSDEARSVRMALGGGALAGATEAAAGDPLRLLQVWDELDPGTRANAAADILALRAALDELARTAGLEPELAPSPV